MARAIEEYASLHGDESSEQYDKAVINDISKTGNYVLDGSSLVQRIPWKNGNTHGAIADSNVDFNVRNYGTATTIVFDGYQETPSTKDNTHDMRQQRHHPLIIVSPNTVFIGKKRWISVKREQQIGAD